MRVWLILIFSLYCHHRDMLWYLINPPPGFCFRSRTLPRFENILMRPWLALISSITGVIFSDYPSFDWFPQHTFMKVCQILNNIGMCLRPWMSFTSSIPQLTSLLSVWFQQHTFTRFCYINIKYMDLYWWDLLRIWSPSFLYTSVEEAWTLIACLPNIGFSHVNVTMLVGFPSKLGI